MRLYDCATCGFISSLYTEYAVREGVRVCKACADRIDHQDETVCRWLNEKMALLDQHDEDCS